MYEELVKRLRHCSEEHSGCGTCELSDTCVLQTRLLLQAADAIEELTAINERQLLEIAVLSKPHWIPVTERLPEEGKPVQVTYLGYYDKKAASDLLACVYEGVWCYWDGEPCSYDPCGVEITHWMPLPEPPKEETT